MMLRVADRGDYEQLSAQVVESPLFTAPYVRCESLSSSVSTFLEGWKDIFWGLRWLLAPAILATLSLVIANAISISVRERRMEIAVLKVLGFSPGQVLILILGEAVLIGSLAGLASSIGTYVLINGIMRGMPFPILWFGKIFIPVQAIWWGLAIGAGTAFVGSFVPAWSARSVRVADVFSKIA
jgi:putative ABC transport system permease protein